MGQGGQVTKADRGRLGADPALAKRFNQPIQSIVTLDHCRAGRLGAKSMVVAARIVSPDSGRRLILLGEEDKSV